MCEPGVNPSVKPWNYNKLADYALGTLGRVKLVGPDGELLVNRRKDLALLVGPDQKWLTTTGFLDKVDANLKTAMA